jgi:N-acetylneuraminic acid mutarotase
MTTLVRRMVTGMLSKGRPPFLGGALTHSVKLADLPVGLDQNGFEECAGLLYSVGGETTVISSNGVYALDPLAGTWATKAVLPVSVESPVLRAVNGKLYCIGGLVSELTPTAAVNEYNPSNNTWTSKANMPTAREDMGSAVVDGKIYVFGGLTVNNTPTKVLEVYDPATDTWDTSKAPLPEFKHFGDFGCQVDGVIYAMGGSRTFANYPTLTPDATCYKYVIADDRWYTIANMPIPTCYKELVVLNGIVYSISGCTDNTTTYSNLIQSYNPARNQWAIEPLLSPLVGRGIGACVYDGKIYLAGSFNVGANKPVYRLGTNALGPELVYNGGFETGNPPLSWGTLWQPSVLSAVADPRPGSTGTKAMYISPSTAGGAGDANQAVALLAGHTYFLQAWMRNVNGSVVNLILYSSAYAVLVNIGNADTAWANFQVAFTCPTDGSIAVFTNTGGQNSLVGTDDFSIKEIL